MDGKLLQAHYRSGSCRSFTVPAHIYSTSLQPLSPFTPGPPRIAPNPSSSRSIVPT
ncbi:hypothetical protein BOTBODRAFT_28390 [Botryobasidium botryosum FD-172 SS1]|uniref:Uncharacterized protein n=1 Tax=Botryobasidium botryosum (strain FD-172 SS1) TaxID=930990 RepID=A0A067MW48_BOTB1|nr:hypothetical protein BOTBODRAFT_28390 [Botryobasidium botryosum FD-172 SS1]